MVSTTSTTSTTTNDIRSIDITPTSDLVHYPIWIDLRHHHRQSGEGYMYTYPPSPIFIRPSFPSIRSTPASSKDATPATSPPESPRQVAPQLERSKCAEATVGTSTTSGPIKHQTTQDEELWQQHTTSPLTAPTSPWYTQSRNNLQALRLNIPCSAYTNTHRMYLQQHPSNSSATTALYPPPRYLATP